jgi:hypothetical protein
MDASAFAILRAPTTHLFATGSMLVDSPTTQQSLGALTFFTSSTKLGWGPTTGSIASLNISVPGGGKISSASLKIVDPDESWWSAKKDWGAAFKIATYGSSLSFTGIKVDVTGVGASNSSMKLENTGCFLAKKGQDLMTAGSAICTIGASMITAGIWSLQ